MDKKDKKLVILFIIMAVLLIGGTVFYLIDKIKEPYFVGQLDIELPSDEEVLDYLKTIDTDKDGLSDYEERFEQGTSIYLADSDSDGYLDKEEIEAGSHPLNINSTPLSPDVEEKEISEEPIVKEQEIEENFSEEEIDPLELRNILVEEFGLAADIVDKLDDKTLIEVYNKTAEETGISFSQLKELISQKQQMSQEQTLEDLPDLDIEQLRQILEEEGVDPQILDKIDDNTLIQLFQDIIKD